jgi:hypothetical protein
MYRLRGRYALRALTLLSLGFVAVSCDDDPTEPEDEPNVATMRLTVGSQTVDVDEDGSVTGGPIVISVGSTAISAQFLLPNGQPDPLVTAAEFQLDVESDDEGVVDFTRASAFSGSLVGVVTGSEIVRFSLLHVEKQHADFGPFPISVTVE